MHAAVLCLVLLRVSWALEPRMRAATGRVSPKLSPLMMSEPSGLNEDVLAAVDMLGKDPKDPTEEMKRDIRALVDFFVVAERDNAQGFRSINPSLLLDNSHILTTGRLYEGVMEELLRGDHSSTDIAVIERVDAFLSGFITSERKSRSKMKLNYIIAGASSDRLESAVSLLSETDQIDDDLIMFIDSLIRKKRQVSPGKTNMAEATYDEEGLPNPHGTRPNMPSEVSVTETVDSSGQDSDDGLIGLGEGNDAIAVLQMVRKRLMAEIRTAEKAELRLLSLLLQEDAPDQHAEVIRASLPKVEDKERFETFLMNGIQYLSINDAEVVSAEEGNAEVPSDGASGPFQAANGLGSKKAHLPADTVARMKDILLTLQSIMEGASKNREVFEVKKDESSAK